MKGTEGISRTDGRESRPCFVFLFFFFFFVFALLFLDSGAVVDGWMR
jgi:hypothetical protein